MSTHHAAELEERDARIRELEQERDVALKALDRELVGSENLLDALGTFEETLRKVAFRECASSRMIAECRLAERLLGQFRGLLDRFPVDERDARIRELEQEVANFQAATNRWHGKLQGVSAGIARIASERDAALAKFREFREAVEEQANEWCSVGNWAGSDLRVLLDRFPDEPSDPAQKGGE